MNAVFLDTVGLLAVWDESDQWHSDAAKALAGLKKRGAPVVSTTFVLLECGNAAARRPYRASVDRLRGRLEEVHALIAPTEDEWRRAWAAYSRGEAGNAGIVDLVSFEVMRRLKIKQAFTNDRHFEAAGFEILF